MIDEFIKIGIPSGVPNRNGFNFILDDMDDAMRNAFVAWPERIYILANQSKQVIFKGDPGPEPGFKISDIDSFFGKMN